MRRREFLKTGVAGGVLASTPTFVRAQAAKGKVRLAYLQLGWAATEIIHKEDLLGKRGWQAEYSIVPGAPVPLLNQLGAKNVSLGSTTKLSVIPGGNGPFKYQWYRGHSGSIASPIAGATKSEFTTPAINSPSEFWVRVKNACGSRDSATAVVKPNP